MSESIVGVDKFTLFLKGVCVGVWHALPTCMYKMCAPGAKGSQKKVPGHLELKLWMVASKQVGTET